LHQPTEFHLDLLEPIGGTVGPRHASIWLQIVIAGFDADQPPPDQSTRELTPVKGAFRQSL
jgi:hypothetical protein